MNTGIQCPECEHIIKITLQDLLYKSELKCPFCGLSLKIRKDISDLEDMRNKPHLCRFKELKTNGLGIYAIEECYEDGEGNLWVTNHKGASSKVNFCPVCGYESKSKDKA